MRRTLRVETGQRFGRLTVVDPEVRRPDPGQRYGRRAALCTCDCGTQTVVALDLLLRDDGTRSCGCAQREGIAERSRTHGLSGHPLFSTWHGMMMRCYDETHSGFARYGGRGIAVCERWHDIRLFVEDTEREIGPRPEGYTLDRWPDNDGNYEPGNVRWATRSEQNLNTERHLESVRRRQQPRANAPIRLVLRHIRNHALRAISQRLKGSTPAEYALLAVEHDRDAVIIRVNSGGNALAVEPYLRHRGYCTEYAGSNPDGYGCAVRVTLREPPSGTIGKAMAVMRDNPGLSSAELAERAGVSQKTARMARGRLRGKRLQDELLKEAS
jgi:hypothetical protein